MPFSKHLWYLSAIIYVLLSVRVMDLIWRRSVLYLLIPVLLGLNLVGGTYSTVLLGYALPLEYTRNFLFTGLPFFLLGDFLANRKVSIPNPLLYVGLILFSAGICLENLLLLRSGLLVNSDLFFSTIFLSCSLFLFAAHNTSHFQNRLSVFLGGLGARYATPIYLYHMLLVRCMGFLPVPVLSLPISPLLVFLLTAVLAWFSDRSKQK